MKIIRKSNFDNPMIDDKLIVDSNLLTNKECSAIVDKLNELETSNSRFIYAVVEDDYILYNFEP